MKKILITILVLLSISITGCTNKLVSQEKAKKIALNDANTTEKNVTFITDVKEVEFYHFVFEDEHHTYEYKINSIEGVIEDKEILIKKVANEKIYNNKIDQTSAKNISLDYFEFKEADISEYKIELDETNQDNPIYHVNFIHENRTYSIDIAAINGTPTNAKINQHDTKAQ